MISGFHGKYCPFFFKPVFCRSKDAAEKDAAEKDLLTFNHRLLSCNMPPVLFTAVRFRHIIFLKSGFQAGFELLRHTGSYTDGSFVGWQVSIT